MCIRDRHDVKYINMDRKTEALLYAASRRPVSYTHLDVYKRQVKN